MAGGMPSRRRQISVTAPPHRPCRPSRSSGQHLGRVRRTGHRRRVDSRTASSDGTGHNCSSGTPSPCGWWRKFVPSLRARIASIRSAAASRTCSQLSNTNSRTLPSNAAATDSVTVLPGCWVMPGAAATASGTAAGSVTAASSKNQTPSGNSPARRAATSVARRVLPTPPTPVTDVHQPMSLDRRVHLVEFGLASDRTGGRGAQISRTRIQRPQWWKVGAQALRVDLENLDPGVEVPQPARPQIDQINPAEQTRCRFGPEDLAAVSGGHHPRRTNRGQHRSNRPRATRPHHESPETPSAPAARTPPLCSHGGIHRCFRRGEGRAHTIAGVLEQPASVRLNGRTQHLVMGSQRRPHRVRVGLPPTVEPSTSVNKNVTTPREGR